MTVYEMRIRVCSAYADICNELTSDGLAEAIAEYIRDNSPDALEEPTDIAVEMPLNVTVVYSSTERNESQQSS